MQSDAPDNQTSETPPLISSSTATNDALVPSADLPMETEGSREADAAPDLCNNSLAGNGGNETPDYSVDRKSVTSLNAADNQIETGNTDDINEENSKQDSGLPDERVASVNSPSSYIVTAKIFAPDNQVITRACPLYMNMHEIKYDISQKLRIPMEVLKLKANGEEINDSLPLAGLGAQAFGTIQINIESTDPQEYPLNFQEIRPLPTPDVITVRINTESNQPREMVVEIENHCFKKPFLGGFRNKKTGKEYYNACAQTLPRPFQCPPGGLACRETQTVYTRNASQQTPQDSATQVPGILTSCENEKFMTPRKYVTSDEIENLKEQKALIIQRCWRGHRARKNVAMMRKQENEKSRHNQEIESINKKEDGKTIHSSIRRKDFPSTKSDFEHLYNLVDRWKKSEVQRINASKTGYEKKAEFCSILEKEIEILAAIESHRVQLCEKMAKEKDMEFLEKSAFPVMWTSENGREVQMDTLHTQRARELKDIYEALNNPNLSEDQIIDSLLSLKHAVKQQKCLFTVELETLIDRECDLRARGVPNQQLQALRMRINTLFMQYMQNPDFNPEAHKHIKAYNVQGLIGSVLFCNGCKKFKPLKTFSQTGSAKDLRLCSDCAFNENVTYNRVDFTPYRNILRAVRRDEQRHKCQTSIAFLMQDVDAYYLIDRIWHSRSALSASTDPSELRLCRWDMEKPWSPWNCFLITEDEMKVHGNLQEQPDKVYEAVFVQTVRHKHLLAQLHFKELAVMDKDLINNGDWKSKRDMKNHVSLSEIS